MSNTRSRTPGQSVSMYVAELKKLAEFCNFGDMLKLMLRNCLVCRIGNKWCEPHLVSINILSVWFVFTCNGTVFTCNEFEELVKKNEYYMLNLLHITEHLMVWLKELSRHSKRVWKKVERFSQHLYSMFPV